MPDAKIDPTRLQKWESMGQMTHPRTSMTMRSHTTNRQASLDKLGSPQTPDAAVGEVVEEVRSPMSENPFVRQDSLRKEATAAAATASQSGGGLGEGSSTLLKSLEAAAFIGSSNDSGEGRWLCCAVRRKS